MSKYHIVGNHMSRLIIMFTSINITILVQYRLVDGPNEHEGRLEVRADMILLGWGTVCNNKFDKKDAEVICRSQRKP